MENSNLDILSAFFQGLRPEFQRTSPPTNEGGTIDTRTKSIDSKKALDANDLIVVDAVVIFALKNPERDMFQKACSSQYTDDVKNGVAFRILEIRNESRDIRIAIATQREMGLVSSAILSTISLMTYSPRIIIMGGICAGIEGKANIGDIVIANPTFNHEAGKKTDSGFEANYTQRELSRAVVDICQSLGEDKTLLRQIRDSWDVKTGKPKTELAVHIVPMGSGSSVITEQQTIEKIKIHNRKTVGIDMESFAVAQSAYETLGGTPWLVVKGIQDYANADKNDESREYAAFVSAKFIIEFLKRYFK